MTLIATWLRVELRRRWRSLGVLALLIAISGTTVLAALAGARRGASAVQRLDARTLPATAMILANTPGFDWTPIRRLPEVQVLSNFVVDYAIGAPDGIAQDIGFPFADTNFMTKIEKPVIFSGRTPDQHRADEAWVTREFAKHFHKGVGSTVTITLPTPQQVVDQFGPFVSQAFAGPHVRLHIVGVGETSPRWGADQPGSSGGLQPSNGFYAKYAQNIVGPPGAKTENFVNAIVRLRGGEAAIPRLSHDIARITGRSDIEVTNFPQQERDLQHHIAFESRCLVAFAAAAFIAALFLIGQAIARYAAGNIEELRTLRALGMTPRQAVATALAGPAIAGVFGAAGAVGGAVIASRWLPYGTAGLIEPSPGTSWDWVVFAAGILTIMTLTAGGAALASWWALRAARRDRALRRSPLAAAVGRTGAPVPVVVGTRFALEAGRGRTAVPVRPALLGAVLGVLGTVAAFTFAHGVSDAAHHPERFGQTFQLEGFLGFNGQNYVATDRVMSALRRTPQVAGVDDARTAVATARDQETTSLWAYSTGPKPIPLVILSGRAPETANEIVLAPRSLTSLHAHVGGQVQLTGSRHRSISYHVVGSGLVPAGPHNGYADGGWVTQNGYDALFDGFKFHFVLVTLTPAARTNDAAQALGAAIGKADKSLRGVGFGPPDPLPEVAELHEVEKLPLLLGLFLVLLAIGAVGHALATAVRRRSHDLAVLRALGMTQWQCRWVVVTQASVLALVGVTFGLPLGLAVGRSVWRVVASYTPLQYVPPLALWALVLAGPAALLVANMLAAWPGHRAARLRVASILRTE